jgi:hypothetical protein
MRSRIRTLALATSVASATAGPVAAEEELSSDDFVDREDHACVAPEILADWPLDGDDDHLMHARTTLEPSCGTGADACSDQRSRPNASPAGPRSESPNPSQAASGSWPRAPLAAGRTT